ncbi:hypothetical protein [Novipirellula caenicola]|uniref:hypothetical protein n=1 Tax=Novipirellula caenicola TaxID=1536901 RepID=UPI0031EA9B62
MRWCSVFALLLFALLAILPASLYESVLKRQSGGSAELIIPLLPRFFTGLSLLAAFVAIASWFVGDKLDRALWRLVTQLTRSSRMPDDRRSYVHEAVGWGLVCSVMVLAFDWPAIVWGYFESDDFNLLIDNRTLGFPEVIYATMNDHVYPLGRILIRGFHWTFGTHAVAYNLLAVGTLISLVWSGCLYLRQAGISRLGTLIFACFLVGWTLWGELTSGEYILLMHESLMTAALLVGWATLRFRATHAWRYYVLTSLLVGYACFINISGFWVACAAVVFLTCDIVANSASNPLRQLGQHWRHYLAIGVPMVMAIAFYYHAYHHPDGPRFLSAAGPQRGLMGLTLQWFYTVTTSLISVPLAIPHHLVDFGLLEFAMIASAVVFAAMVLMALPSLPCRSVRFQLVAVLMIMSGVVLMVCLGRPVPGIGHVIPPKYLFMPYTWTCIAIAIAFDGGWQRVPNQWRLLYVKLGLLCLLFAWTSHGVASGLGSRGMPFFETTRGGEIREHQLEFAAMQELRQTIFTPLDKSSESMLRIVDIQGDTLAREFPALRFPWGYEPQLSYMVDVLSDQPTRYQFLYSTDLTFPSPTVSRSLYKSVSPEFIDLIQTSEEANRLYSLPARLIAEARPTNSAEIESETPLLSIVDAVESEQQATGKWIVQSDGRAKIVLRYPEWKSDERSQLQMTIHPPQPTQDAETAALMLSFRSPLFTGETKHFLPAADDSGAVQTIDLLQLPSFSLSEKIEFLSIDLQRSGVYRIEHLSVSAAPSP